jgi:hypothetical protein
MAWVLRKVRERLTGRGRCANKCASQQIISEHLPLGIRPSMEAGRGCLQAVDVRDRNRAGDDRHPKYPPRKSRSMRKRSILSFGSGRRNVSDAGATVIGGLYLTPKLKTPSSVVLGLGTERRGRTLTSRRKAPLRLSPPRPPTVGRVDPQAGAAIMSLGRGARSGGDSVFR